MIEAILDDTEIFTLFATKQPQLLRDFMKENRAKWTITYAEAVVWIELCRKIDNLQYQCVIVYKFILKTIR